ncbi:MAG: hypothetical protein QOG25_1887 [Acetobacteraceae bacterium]|nr:hypothetical protein [Acetobacteraceae bacterium]
MGKHHGAQQKEQGYDSEDYPRHDTGHHAAKADEFGLRRDTCQPKWAHRSAHHAANYPTNGGGDHEGYQRLLLHPA